MSNTQDLNPVQVGSKTLGMQTMSFSFYYFSLSLSLSCNEWLLMSQEMLLHLLRNYLISVGKDVNRNSIEINIFLKKKEEEEGVNVVEQERG